MVHVHVSRRSGLQRLGSQALVELSDCCCFRCLHRLGELVEQELFDRQAVLPARAMDPALLRELPF